MSSVNAKQIVMIIGVSFVFVGLVGLLGNEQEPATNNPSQDSTQQSSLEVKKGNNAPASTIDILQGSGGIQTQGAQPQGANAGANLQPNAGVDSLPRNY